MTSTALTPRRAVLADTLLPRSAVANAALVTGGTALTAVMAQLSVPLWPVPITGQTLAVLLVGSVLGANRGALSMLLYWVAGMLGAPVYSDGGHGLGAALGPSGGYIVGFIISAYAVGRLAERGQDRRFLTAALSFCAGTVITFGFGMAWLALSLGADLQQTLEWGLYPFIAGGVIKALLAAALMPGAWHLAAKLRR
jgi:biotin transport system substrate-specific component